jgi:hypothetical protein
MFLARMGVMKALHRHEVLQFNPDASWGRGGPALIIKFTFVQFVWNENSRSACDPCGR